MHRSKPMCAVCLAALLIVAAPIVAAPATTAPAPAKPATPAPAQPKPAAIAPAPAPKVVVPPVPLIGPGSATAPGPMIDSLTPTLSWSSIAGAMNYGVTVNEVGTNATAFKKIGHTGTSIAMPDQSLAWGKKYWWTVLASTKDGTTEKPQQFYFQTPALTSPPNQAAAISPGAAGGPGPTLGADAPILLRWNKAMLADDYTVVIYDITSGTPGTAVLSKGKLTDLSLSVPASALGRGARYAWTVVASNRLGFGPESRLFFQLPFTPAVAKPTTPPAAPVAQTPGDASADGQYVNTLTPTLTWSDVPSAESYTVSVKRCDTGAVAFEAKQIRALTVTLPANAITYEQKYCWQVTATNAFGSSAPSKILKFQGPIFSGAQLAGASPTPRSPGATAAPGPALDTLSPTLAWDGVPNASMYQVTVTETASGQAVLKQYPVAGLTTALGPILAAGKQYSWAVQAVQQLGAGGRAEGPMSRPLYFQVGASVKPSLPELIGPGAPMAPGEVLTATPTFSWRMVKDIYFFQVHIFDVTDRPVSTDNYFYSANVQEVWRYHNGEPDKPVLTHTVPAGQLTPGRRYAWNVAGMMANYTTIVSGYRYFQVK